jgi:hypothetical protein
MKEYAVSLDALENTWTVGVLLLMLRTIVERYQRSRRAHDEPTMEAGDLLHGDWASG